MKFAGEDKINWRRAGALYGEGKDNNATAVRQSLEKRIYWQKDGQAKKSGGIFARAFFNNWRLFFQTALFFLSLQTLIYITSFAYENVVKLALLSEILLPALAVFLSGIFFERLRGTGENLRAAAESVFAFSFSLGLVSAIFKFFLFWRYWTIYNLISEPVITGVIAVGVVLIGEWLLARGGETDYKQ